MKGEWDTLEKVEEGFRGFYNLSSLVGRNDQKQRQTHQKPTLQREFIISFLNFYLFSFLFYIYIYIFLLFEKISFFTFLPSRAN